MTVGLGRRSSWRGLVAALGDGDGGRDSGSRVADIWGPFHDSQSRLSLLFGCGLGRKVRCRI